MVNTSEIKGLKRAESQRKVLLFLVEIGEPMSSKEISNALSLSVNAVNIALFNLYNKGLVDRISRGIYKYKLGPLLGKLLEEYFKE
jgi:predicted transcriptional regulator